MKKFKSLMLAAAMIGLSSVTSYAVTNPPELINIRFGGGVDNILPFSGPAIVGSTGDYWNPVIATALLPANVGQGATAVKYADNALSSVTFAYTADLNVNGAAGVSGFGGGPYAELMRNYISTSDGTTVNAYDTLDFAGLVGGKSYKIWVYTQTADVEINGWGDNQKLHIDFRNELDTSTIASWETSAYSNGGASKFIVNQNYLTGDIVANGDGSIHMRYSSPLNSSVLSENTGAINGVQIATPEPASMLLIGVGGALMSAMKARKKKSAEKSIV